MSLLVKPLNADDITTHQGISYISIIANTHTAFRAIISLVFNGREFIVSA